MAAITFEITKHGFVFYLSQFHGYQKLYGAFAVIPVFFIWVYIVWLITLFGAEIGFAWEKKITKATKTVLENAKKSNRNPREVGMEIARELVEKKTRQHLQKHADAAAPALLPEKAAV